MFYSGYKKTYSRFLDSWQYKAGDRFYLCPLTILLNTPLLPTTLKTADDLHSHMMGTLITLPFRPSGSAHKEPSKGVGVPWDQL